MTRNELLNVFYAMPQAAQDEFLERYGFERISDADTNQMQEFLKEKGNESLHD